MELIIASHTVKPSSPTPLACKSHKLSFIDQIAPPIYIPLIFFYENEKSEQRVEITRRLTQSLSEILTIFYPLAGTIKANSSVDCNDRGAEFVEARVHARLAQFIQNPKTEELEQLIPVDILSHDANVILSVKTSFFDCGGIAVGVCLSHKIADAASFATFMNAWAAACRGEGSIIIHPTFDLAATFPPKELLSTTENLLGITRQKILTKRFVFDKERLETLKQQAASSEVKDPSKVEVVTDFMLRSFIGAGKRGTTPSIATHAVNLRPRTIPPMPAHTFGNCVTHASTVVTTSEEEDGSGSDHVHVSKLRAMIRSVDDGYINNVLKGDKFLEIIDQIGDFFKEGNFFFSSWRFPMYDVDFGWGKPVWVCPTPMPRANVVTLMDNPSGDGIEAWVNIPDHQHI